MYSFDAVNDGNDRGDQPQNCDSFDARHGIYLQRNWGSSNRRANAYSLCAKTDKGHHEIMDMKHANDDA